MTIEHKLNWICFVNVYHKSRLYFPVSKFIVKFPSNVARNLLSRFMGYYIDWTASKKSIRLRSVIIWRGLVLWQFKYKHSWPLYLLTVSVCISINDSKYRLGFLTNACIDTKKCVSVECVVVLYLYLLIG